MNITDIKTDEFISELGYYMDRQYILESIMSDYIVVRKKMYGHDHIVYITIPQSLSKDETKCIIERFERKQHGAVNGIR